MLMRVRYEGGSRVPSRIAGKKSPVDLAERAFPGTAFYFNSIIWDLLKGRRLTLEEACDVLWAMSDEVRDVIFSREHVVDCRRKLTL